MSAKYIVMYFAEEREPEKRGFQVRLRRLERRKAGYARLAVSRVQLVFDDKGWSGRDTNASS